MEALASNTEQLRTRLDFVSPPLGQVDRARLAPMPFTVRELALMWPDSNEFVYDLFREMAKA